LLVVEVVAAIVAVMVAAVAGAQGNLETPDRQEGMAAEVLPV
tara:strand:- start:203 stop:328 length:126 start_codon:yes stop_codon:yes gene_type:complete